MKNIVKEYIDEIDKYVVVPDTTEIYVMEKEKPVYMEKKNIVKDGVHIMITNIVTRPSVQLIVRKKLLSKFGKIMKHMKTTNNIDDIFDEQVIYKNNWQMYVSKKPNN